MADKDELQLLVRATDQASATLSAIHKSLQGLGATAEQSSSKLDKLGERLMSLAQGIKRGIGEKVGETIIDWLSRGFDKLIAVLPEAIQQGQEYLGQLRQVQRLTGMTAEQTSTLVGVFDILGGRTSVLEVLMSRLGKNLGETERYFSELNVATRKADGTMLGSYDIISNLREQVSKHGASLLSTAAAEKLFGRQAYELIPFLQMTNEQWKIATENVRQWGGVMTNEALVGVERFNRDVNNLQFGLKAMSSNIFSAIEPVLRGFITGFSNFLKQHMEDIKRFAVSAASFVLGLIGGLLGIDFDIAGFADSIGSVADQTGNWGNQLDNWVGKAEGAKKGEDRLSASIKHQISLIDDQIRAIDALTAKRHANTEKAKLQAAIDAAQGQLNDLMGNQPYLAGLNAGEAELAQQKYAQDILDARKTLADAIAALNNFTADQAAEAQKSELQAKKDSLQEQLSAHQAALSQMTAANNSFIKGVASDQSKLSSLSKASFAAMTATAKEWRDKGVGFATDIKKAVGGLLDLLIGSEVAVNTTGDRGESTGKMRTGGLAGALGDIGQHFRDLGRNLALAAVGLDLIGTAVRIFIGTATRMMGIVSDIVHFDFGAAAVDTAQMQEWIRQQAADFAHRSGQRLLGLQMGGQMTPGGIYRVGEVAAETVYMDPHGRGATVYGRPNASSGGGGGAGHGHDIYLDGRLVGRALDARNYRTGLNASTSMRPIGSS